MEHAAVLDEEDAARATRRAHGVRDHEDGLPGGVDLAEEVQQLVGRAGVERAGRLVGQQDAGLRNQGARHGGALLLPAGDLIGVLRKQLVDPQTLRQRQKALLHLAPALPREDERQADVVLERKGIKEVELLKHETEVVAAEGRHVALAHPGEILSVEQHAPRRRAVERGEDVQQRRLAAARFAHDGDVLALLHLEIHIPQRLDLLAAEAGGIDLLQALNMQ